MHFLVTWWWRFKAFRDQFSVLPAPKPGPSYIAPRTPRLTARAQRRPLPELDEQFEAPLDDPIDVTALEAPVAVAYSLLPERPRAYKTEKGWFIGPGPSTSDDELGYSA